jgi:hypothetical protein
MFPSQRIPRQSRSAVCGLERQHKALPWSSGWAEAREVDREGESERKGMCECSFNIPYNSRGLIGPSHLISTERVGSAVTRRADRCKHRRKERGLQDQRHMRLLHTRYQHRGCWYHGIVATARYIFVLYCVQTTGAPAGRWRAQIHPDAPARRGTGRCAASSSCWGRPAPGCGPGT